MSYVISSGSTNKAAVYAKHLRTFDYSCSLLNHLSTEANGRIPMRPEPNINAGVFTGITTKITSGSLDLFAIANSDEQNLMIIDRLFVQVFSSSGTLPDSITNITVNVSSGTPTANPDGITFLTGENRSISINPTLIGPNALQLSQIGTTFLTLGDTVVLINQLSDGIILDYGKGMVLLLNNPLGLTLGIQTFMRIAIGDFEEFQ